MNVNPTIGMTNKVVPMRAGVRWPQRAKTTNPPAWPAIREIDGTEMRILIQRLVAGLLSEASTKAR